jgi:hypothetical protein
MAEQSRVGAMFFLGGQHSNPLNEENFAPFTLARWRVAGGE